MSEREELQTDPLFLGLTRPTTALGIPIGAFILEAMVVVIAFLASHNIFTMLIALPLHAGLYAISAKDGGIFHEVFLAVRTNAPAQNRKLWRAASYSPMPAMRKKSNI